MNIREIMVTDDAAYVGTVRYHGMLLGIEHVAGDVNPWSQRPTQASYGEFPGTLANDGDPVDFLLGDQWDTKLVYVLRQSVPPGQNEEDHSEANGGGNYYDEDKVALGARSIEHACELFHDYYHGSGRLIEGVLVMTVEELKNRIYSDEYRSLPIFPVIEPTVHETHADRVACLHANQAVIKANASAFDTAIPERVRLLIASVGFVTTTTSVQNSQSVTKALCALHLRG